MSQRASVDDRYALEALIATLPPSARMRARALIKIPGSRRMHFAEVLQSVYVLWHERADRVFTYTTFRNIKSMDQASELWAEIETLSAPDTGIMMGLYSRVTGFRSRMTGSR